MSLLPVRQKLFALQAKVSLPDASDRSRRSEGSVFSGDHPALVKTLFGLINTEPFHLFYKSSSIYIQDLGRFAFYALGLLEGLRY